jgi:hypothetical protein
MLELRPACENGGAPLPQDSCAIRPTKDWKVNIRSGNARKAGATDAERVEAATIASALRGEAAVTHATYALTIEPTSWSGSMWLRSMGL